MHTSTLFYLAFTHTSFLAVLLWLHCLLGIPKRVRCVTVIRTHNQPWDSDKWGSMKERGRGGEAIVLAAENICHFCIAN